MGRMKNKMVMITGASSGIGKACAEKFASEGARLILIARREARLKALTTFLQDKYQSQILPIVLDVTKRQKVVDILGSLDSHWQYIDILINNAGLAAGADRVQEASIDDWEAMIDTNVKGLLYVTKTVLPAMTRTGIGHIVNIGSVSGHQTYSGGSVYCATKHAVRAFTEGLKLDLADTRIRVSLVDPGMVETEFSEVRFKGDKAKSSAVYQGFKPLQPEDVADAVYYCASRPPHVDVQDIILYPTAQSSVNSVRRDRP